MKASDAEESMEESDGYEFCHHLVNRRSEANGVEVVHTIFLKKRVGRARIRALHKRRQQDGLSIVEASDTEESMEESDVY